MRTSVRHLRNLCCRRTSAQKVAPSNHQASRQDLVAWRCGRSSRTLPPHPRTGSWSPSISESVRSVWLTIRSSLWFSKRTEMGKWPPPRVAEDITHHDPPDPPVWLCQRSDAPQSHDFQSPRRHLSSREQHRNAKQRDKICTIFENCVEVLNRHSDGHGADPLFADVMLLATDQNPDRKESQAWRSPNLRGGDHEGEAAVAAGLSVRLQSKLKHPASNL